MTSQERINTLLEHLNVGPIELATILGLKKNRIHDINRGKVKKIALDVADVICTKYPTVNKDWLLYGTGDMLVASDRPIEKVVTEVEYYQSVIDRQQDTINSLIEQLSTVQKDLSQALATINQITKKSSTPMSYMVAEDIQK